MLFCGVLADRLFLRGVREGDPKPKPERRLPLLVVTGAIGVAGCLIFGICTQEHTHWIGPLFGSACGKFVTFYVSSCMTEINSELLLHMLLEHFICIPTRHL